MTSRLASVLALVSTFATVACGTTDINVGAPPPAADAATDRAQPDAAPADTGPRMMCGDGICAGPDDCARDCRDVADASAPTDAATDAQQPADASVADAGPACMGADLRVDARNCGTCGNVCNAGQLCVAGTCTTPMSPDGGMPAPGGIDTWVITYETAAGDGAVTVQNWIMRPIYTSCTTNRTPSALVVSSTCTFRFTPDSSRDPWFNSHFDLPPSPETGTQTRSTWSVFMRYPGAAPEFYGSIHGTRNGVAVEFEPVLNAMGDGYNWRMRRR